MKLLTKKIEQKLLNTKINDEDNIFEQEIIVKYFHPMGRYTFYALEGQKYGDDIILFGYCVSPLQPEFDEFGYQSLNELQQIPLMERDLNFEKKCLKDVGITTY